MPKGRSSEGVQGDIFDLIREKRDVPKKLWDDLDRACRTNRTCMGALYCCEEGGNDKLRQTLLNRALDTAKQPLHWRDLLGEFKEDSKNWLFCAGAVIAHARINDNLNHWKSVMRCFEGGGKKSATFLYEATMAHHKLVRAKHNVTKMAK